MFLDTTEWLKNPSIKWIDKVNRFDKKKIRLSINFAFDSAANLT